MLSRRKEGCAGSGHQGPVLAASLFLAGLLAATAPAIATTVKHLGLKEIVGASDVIVEARVESTRAFWKGRQILTEVTLGVGRTMKGAQPGRLTFLQVGGRVESPVPLEMSVPGAPIYRAGDEAYFFLEAGKTGEHYVVGLFQGNIPLRHDARGDYVVHDGSRLSPAEFEEVIHRHLAGQKQDPAGGAR